MKSFQHHEAFEEQLKNLDPDLVGDKIMLQLQHLSAAIVELSDVNVNSAHAQYPNENTLVNLKNEYIKLIINIAQISRLLLQDDNAESARAKFQNDLYMVANLGRLAVNEQLDRIGLGRGLELLGAGKFTIPNYRPEQFRNANVLTDEVFVKSPVNTSKNSNSSLSPSLLSLGISNRRNSQASPTPYSLENKEVKNPTITEDEIEAKINAFLPPLKETDTTEAEMTEEAPTLTDQSLLLIESYRRLIAEKISQSQDNNTFANENLRLVMHEFYGKLTQLCDHWQTEVKSIDKKLALAEADEDDKNISLYGNKIGVLYQECMDFMTPLLNFDNMVYAIFPKLSHFISREYIQPIQDVLDTTILAYKNLTKDITNPNIKPNADTAKMAYVTVYEKLLTLAKNIPEEKEGLYASPNKPKGKEIEAFLTSRKQSDNYQNYKSDVDPNYRISYR